MKRSPMPRKAPALRQAKQISADYTLRPRATPVAIPGPARASVPIPKPERCKPGKRAPTAAERAWMDWIVSTGCIACRIDGLLVKGKDGTWSTTPPAVHHILRGGLRIGHLFTLPLCDPGHHQNGGPDRISRHPWKKRFEARYGAELELLERLRAERSETWNAPTATAPAR